MTLLKSVDYSKIATRFDRYRRELVNPDTDLEGILKAHAGAPFTALDVGCGTANYLEVQIEYFKDYNIRWIGMDPSDAMLRIARDKVRSVNLMKGRVESLPYKSGAFNFITTQFTFHHFTDKPRALDEIYRVLSGGGVLKMVNIQPEKMIDWIVYRYFPAAYGEDMKRFWKADLLQDELINRGFDVTLKIEPLITGKKLSERLQKFINRDTSQLWVISEDDYQKGIAAIEEDLKVDPEAIGSSHMAIITCMAQKGGNR